MDEQHSTLDDLDFQKTYKNREDRPALANVIANPH